MTISKVSQIVGIAAGVVILAVAGIYFATREPEKKIEPPKPGIVVEKPAENELVSFPLTVKGYVTGEDNWVPFEAQAGTVQAFEADGSPVSIIQSLMAAGEWMNLPSRFEATIYKEDVLNEPQSDIGYLLFENENAGGEQEKNREFRVPVKYK